MAVAGLVIRGGSTELSFDVSHGTSSREGDLQAASWRLMLLGTNFECLWCSHSAHGACVWIFIPTGLLCQTCTFTGFAWYGVLLLKAEHGSVFAYHVAVNIHFLEHSMTQVH